MEEKGRLQTLLNKGSQLETLCGVDVCVVCIDPVSGEVFTWPKDRSKVVGIIQRYRSCSTSSSSSSSKKRKLSPHPHPQSSVSVASPDAIPGICYYQNPNVSDQLPLLGLGSSQDTFDPSDMMIPEFWYSEIDDGLGVSGLGSNSDGFGIKIEPRSGGDDMADELEALDSMIRRIEDLESSLGKKKQEEVRVEEQQSEATQVDLDFDFDVDDNFWNELPQLMDPNFTPTCCDCNYYGLGSFDFC